MPTFATAQSARHARRVRHATEEDLDQIDDLLVALRGFSELTERKRGYFSRRSRAFVHFHAEATDYFADVRLGGAFVRLKVTSQAERAEFLSRIHLELRGESKRAR